MITFLSLDNFQSWKRLDMDLAPITVIVGRGNTGKSAIVRALSYALTNKGGDDFIRRGASSTSVAMLINGHELVWKKERGKGGVYYLDDQTFTKTGTTVPPEVLEATGIRPIEVEKGHSLMPNIHAQFDQPFLVFESGSRMARVLGKLTKVDTIITAQMAARRDLKDAEKALEMAKHTVEEQERFLLNLPDTEELRNEYSMVREEVQEAERASIASLAASAALQAYRDAAREAVDYTGLAAECSGAIEAIDNAIAVTDAWERYHRAVAGYADESVALDTLMEKLDECAKLYEELCREAGVCEVCPWK